ncbi:MAG: hypothetical protein U5K38_09715 [Woeseiaceae bacterium]|nr:hypothetical protein [Woeseiaceae bacterium]
MAGKNQTQNNRIEYAADLSPTQAAMLTDDALDMIAALCDEFAPRVRELAASREAAQQGDGTERRLNLSPATEPSGAGDWRIADVPEVFRASRLELVVPPERAALDTALGSGADCCIVNLADALAPSAGNAIGAQAALHESLRDTSAAATHRPAILLRPRPLFATEPGLLWHGEPVPAAIADTCLYIVHNAALLEQQTSGVYLELAHLASQDDARLWRDLIRHVESAGRTGSGTVRAAIRIDTVPSAFAIDDILGELRDYAVGLHTDFIAYTASFIRMFQHSPAFMLPDRAELTVTTPFLSALATHVVRAGRRRGIPTSAPPVTQSIDPDDHEASTRSLSLAKRDLSWYRQLGFDRLRVVDPDLVSFAADIYDTVHPAPESGPGRAPVTADDLLQTVRGKITRTGLRDNLGILLRYLPAASEGRGTVIMSGQLHDADSARLALAQLWQWARHATGVLDEGRNIDTAMIREMLDEEEGGADAASDLLQLISSETLSDNL